jgi:hypothetical protein
MISAEELRKIAVSKANERLEETINNLESTLKAKANQGATSYVIGESNDFYLAMQDAYVRKVLDNAKYTVKVELRGDRDNPTTSYIISW